MKAIAEGKKVAEWRRNDRDYRVGDVLILREHSDDLETTKSADGDELVRPTVPDDVRARNPIAFGWRLRRAAIVKVTHVQRGGEFEIPIEFCILSFRLLHAE